MNYYIDLLLRWHPMAGDVTLGAVVLRITVAGVAGLVLGWERQSRNQSVGTYDLSLWTVAIAGATMLSAYGFTGPVMDPTRISAQLVTLGGGFAVGATVLRFDRRLKGLTTGITLVLSLALGMAAGAGAFGLLAVMQAYALLMLLVARRAPRHARVHIELADPASRAKLVAELRAGRKLRRVREHSDLSELTIEVAHADASDLTEQLARRPEIARVKTHTRQRAGAGTRLRTRRRRAHRA